MSNITITPGERSLLTAILNSEYHDDPLAEVWTNCLWGWSDERKFGGTMASLVKKGLAWSSKGGGRDATCRLTEAGWAALDHAPIGRPDIERASK